MCLDGRPHPASVPPTPLRAGVADAGIQGVIIRPPALLPLLEQSPFMTSVSSSLSSSAAAAASAHAGGNGSVAASAAAPTQRYSVPSSQAAATAPLQSLTQKRAGSNGSGSGVTQYQAGGSYGATQAPPTSASQSASPLRGAWRDSLSAGKSANGSSAAAAALGDADGDWGAAANEAPPASASQSESPVQGTWRDGLSGGKGSNGSSAAAAALGDADEDWGVAANEAPFASASRARGSSADSSVFNSLGSGAWPSTGSSYGIRWNSEAGRFYDTMRDEPVTRYQMEERRHEREYEAMNEARREGKETAVPYVPDSLNSGSESSGTGGTSGAGNETRYRYDKVNDRIWDTLGAVDKDDWRVVTKAEASCFGSTVKGYDDSAFSAAYKTYRERHPFTDEEKAERANQKAMGAGIYFAP
jgi:hypothetical protein